MENTVKAEKPMGVYDYKKYAGRYVIVHINNKELGVNTTISLDKELFTVCEEKIGREALRAFINQLFFEAEVSVNSEKITKSRYVSRKLIGWCMKAGA